MIGTRWKVCDLLRPCVRKVDTVARYGGEEFMVLLPQTAKEGAVAVGEKLRRAVLDAVRDHKRAGNEGCKNPGTQHGATSISSTD